MLFPIGDDNPRASTPWVTYGVLSVFTLATLVGMAGSNSFVQLLGLDIGGEFESQFVHQLATLILGAFLLSFFAILADNVEDRLGSFGFGGFVVAVAISSLILETIVADHIDNAVVVGIVSACAAAYVVWFPHHEIRLVTFYSRHRGGIFGRQEPVLDVIRAPAMYVLLGLLLLLGFAVSFFETLYTAPVLVGVGFGVATAIVANRLLPDPEAHEQLHGGRFVDPDRSSMRRSGSERAADSVPVVTPPIERANPSAERGERAEPEVPSRGGILSSADDTVELDPTEHGWAVVRTTDDMVAIPTVGRLVAKTTNEPLFDVTRRIRGTRGVLAIGLGRNIAKRCAKVVAEGGIGCRAIPWGPHLFPGSERAARVAWSAEQLAVETTGGELREYPWSRVRLAAGYQLTRKRTAKARRSVSGGNSWDAALFSSTSANAPVESIVEQVIESTQTFIELFVEPPGVARHWIRMRIPVEEVEFVADGIVNRERKFASFLESRPEIAKNPAISIIANGRGRWSYLRFKGRQLAALYLAWLLSLVGRAETSDPAIAPDVSSFIE